MNLRILLILLIIIEIVLHGDSITIPFNVHLRPIIIALVGLLIGWVAILQSRSDNAIHFNIESIQPYLKLAPTLGALIAGIFLYRYLDGSFSASPVQLAESDIIPTIQELVSRFLDGEQVYRPVDFGTWQVIPGYMPMQWMPYAFADILEFDFRWIPYLTLGTALFILSYKAYTQPDRAVSILLIIGLILFLFDTLDSTQPKIYLTTVEWTMASFYILLCTFLDSKRFWIIGLVLFLCLFSRYSLLFWLLPLAFVYWDRHSLKFNLSIAGVVIALAMVTYFIPYFFSDTSIFSDAIAYYKNASVYEWTRQSWIPEDQPPQHLGKGYGFAFYFWKYLDHLPIAGRLETCIFWHRILSIVSAIGLAYYYFKNKIHLKHPTLYLIAALKIYFVFFYGFVQIPYLYLMTVPLVISIMTLYISNRSDVQS